MKSFSPPHQGIVQDQPENETTKKVKLLGFALLRKDSLTGKKYWVTWDGEGNHEVSFSADQPLVFPPSGVQVGTRVHLLPPEE